MWKKRSGRGVDGERRCKENGRNKMVKWWLGHKFCHSLGVKIYELHKWILEI